MNAVEQVTALCAETQSDAMRLMAWMETQSESSDPRWQALREVAEVALRDVALVRRRLDERPTVVLACDSHATTAAMVRRILGVTDATAFGRIADLDARIPIIEGFIPEAGIGCSVRYTVGSGDGSRRAEQLARSHAEVVLGRASPLEQQPSVRARLLSLADVVIILSELYLTAFAHEKKDHSHHIAAVMQHAREHLAPESKMGGLTALDARRIRQRLLQGHAAHPLMRALSAANYWNTLAALALHLAGDDRAMLLSALWGGEANVTAIFEQVYRCLESVSFAGEIVFGTDAIHQINATTGWLEQHSKSLLSRTTARGEWPGDEEIAVRSRIGTSAMYPRDVATLLVSEVCVFWDGHKEERRSVADLLLVPGSRGGLKHVGTRSQPSHRRSALKSDLRDGFMAVKAVHLAELALVEQVGTFAVLVSESGSEVKALLEPSVSRWLGSVAGVTPAEREDVSPPLLVAIEAPATEAISKDAVGPTLSGFEGAGWHDEWSPERRFDGVIRIGPQRAAIPIDARQGCQGQDPSAPVASFSSASSGHLAQEDFDRTMQDLLRTRKLSDLNTEWCRRIAVVTRDRLQDHAQQHLPLIDTAKSRLRRAKKLHARLQRLARDGHLGGLMSQLMISEAELRKTLQIATGVWLNRRGGTPQQRLSAHDALSFADHLSRTAQVYWTQHMLAIAGSSGTAASLFPGGSRDLSNFVHELIIGADRLEVFSGEVRRVLSAKGDDPTIDTIVNLSSWTLGHAIRRFLEMQHSSTRATEPDEAGVKFSLGWCAAYINMVEDNDEHGRFTRFDQDLSQRLVELEAAISRPTSGA